MIYAVIVLERFFVLRKMLKQIYPGSNNVNGCTFCEYTKKHGIVSSKGVNFMVYMLYLKKAIIKDNDEMYDPFNLTV